MPDKILEINKLQVGFAAQVGYQPAVNGVEFGINRGETFVLLGESGCGKSLTSLAIMNLLPPAARFMGTSQVLLYGKDLIDMSEVELRKIRGRQVAMIFQEPMTSLNPVMTVGQQIAEVLHFHFGLKGRVARERSLELLHQVGLPEPERQLQVYPHQLSGGMKQRVMIAMALAGEPDLLIADEPTSALDVTIQAQILDLLKSLQLKNNMAILMITHDLTVVRQVADQVAVMYAGHIVEQASRDDFFAEPKHPYSQGLFASQPSITKRDQALAVIPGMVPSLTSDFTGCRFASRCPYVWQSCHDIAPKLLTLGDKHVVRCHLYDKDIAATRPQKTISAYAPDAMPQFVDHDEIIMAIDDLKIHFPIQRGILKRTVGYVKAVDGVSLELTKGKTLALVGESGCGKTTLARGILRLIETTSGMVEIAGNNVSDLSASKLRALRAEAQIIFQDPFSAMNPRQLVADVIAEGMRALKIGKDETQRQARVVELLAQVGLPADSGSRYPHEFSGGQRQRICIARALAVNPRLIICDEPTSALDVSVQAQILNLLRRLQAEQGLSYLFITHNMSVVSYIADEIAVMYQGKIVEHGSCDDVLHRPQHAYTKKLLAAI